MTSIESAGNIAKKLEPGVPARGREVLSTEASNQAQMILFEMLLPKEKWANIPEIMKGQMMLAWIAQYSEAFRDFYNEFSGEDETILEHIRKPQDLNTVDKEEIIEYLEARKGNFVWPTVH